VLESIGIANVARSLFLLLAEAMIGCAGERAPEDDGAGAWLGAVSDSAGVRIVSNPTTGIWTDETTWTLERDLSIGVVDGPQEYQLGRVVDVDVAEDRIYVLDQQAAEIRVFDRDGSYLLAIGGPGQGPGELSRQAPGARAVLTTPLGDVFVPDQGNGRVNRFTLSGDFLGSFSIRMEEGLSVAWSTAPTGEYIAHHSSPTWSGLLRIAPEGAVLDTIIEFEPRAPGIYAEGRREAMEHAALWTVLPDGRVISGVSDRFRIEVRSPDGDLEMVIKRDPEAHRLSEAEKQRFLQRLAEVWAEMFRERGESEAWIESQLRQVSQAYVAPTYPPTFTGLAGGPEGTIWIRKALPIDSMTPAVLDGFRRPVEEFWSSTWEVFSEEGRYLGDVSMPSRFTPHKIRGSRIYGVERDALGVHRVVRLRILLP
jgi:hypothetical protein